MRRIRPATTGARKFAQPIRLVVEGLDGREERTLLEVVRHPGHGFLPSEHAPDAGGSDIESHGR